MIDASVTLLPLDRQTYFDDELTNWWVLKLFKINLYSNGYSLNNWELVSIRKQGMRLESHEIFLANVGRVFFFYANLGFLTISTIIIF